ncbi:hypothetical protein LRS05_16640 [Flavobacterium sp. J372]|uniref:hypothetical protein n=1 Tax=Flavobacterium sp. J372 TaxID=2898436 RepID=UPI002151D96A|nr:hypothetical protein [Flavobacterium sp. J372]MCR5862643.1 hypothetical protein [Flavobacterium sp. J372]MCR5863580.1 hypothetical protein [Flavobacterium sp. J372]MCR5863626.1 hypothetical protein [Flavobacterium sp. J372]
MDKFSIKEIFEDEINSLWNIEQFRSIPLYDRGYAIPDETKTKSLLFVGINPSYYLQ